MEKRSSNIENSKKIKNEIIKCKKSQKKKSLFIFHKGANLLFPINLFFQLIFK